MKQNAIYDPKYQVIISRLVNARKVQNLTQKELAEKIHLSQDKISRIESCQRQIGVLELLQWIDAAKMTDWKAIVRKMMVMEHE